MYESLYTHGHRIKNLMGLAGNRLRRLARRTEDPDLAREMQDLVTDQAGIYEQWVAYLRTMKPDTVSPSLVDLAPLVRQAAEAVAGQRPEGTLSFTTQEHLPRIKADPAMLREAITNVVLNAFDAIGPGGKVAVQTGFDGEANAVFVEVEDDGAGIPEDLRDRIFDPGFSTREQGNGYGLSICSRIVAAHRGTVRVASREGEGTVFRIDLPVDVEIPAEEEAIGLLSAVPEPASHPIAEEFLE